MNLIRLMDGIQQLCMLFRLSLAHGLKRCSVGLQPGTALTIGADHGQQLNTPGAPIIRSIGQLRHSKGMRRNISCREWCDLLA